MKIINLSDKELTTAQTEVLSLGLSFSPVSHFDFFTAVKDLHLFVCKLIFKNFFHLRNSQGNFTAHMEQEALGHLEHS